MAPYGMRLEVVSSEVGTAAATKMFRSIVVKGLEALIFECVLGASRYGAEQRVFDSLGETFPGIDWNALANYMIGRVVVHGERRAREMEEVAETLRHLAIEPHYGGSDGAAHGLERTARSSRPLPGKRAKRLSRSAGSDRGHSDRVISR